MFVEAVTRLWHIVNVKTPHDGVLLNGKDREPIKIVTDDRLIFLQQMANAFLEINTSSSQYKSCVKCLTVDTSEALHLTLIGLIDMVKILLVNKKIAYVLLGEFQSDWLEGEFGIMRQMSGGNYYISYEQILSSVKLRRLKLFTQLEVPYNNTHEDDICCETELNDHEVDFMDNCFEMVDTISLYKIYFILHLWLHHNERKNWPR